MKVQFMAFDLLSLSGRSLMKDTYDQRRKALEDHVTPSGSIQVPPAFEGDEAAAIQSSRALKLEGVVAKRRDSTYLPGKRSRGWVKIKHHRSQEVVIGGWTPGRGTRTGTVGALLLGVQGPSGLLYVGKVGTGFSADDLAAMMTRFAQLSRETSPFLDLLDSEAADVRWLSPQLTGEVEFAEWTATGRLRHPSWRGWRPDKDPSEVAAET